MSKYLKPVLWTDRSITKSSHTDIGITSKLYRFYDSDDSYLICLQANCKMLEFWQKADYRGASLLFQVSFKAKVIKLRAHENGS